MTQFWTPTTPNENQNTAALAKSRSETAGAWYEARDGNALRELHGSMKVTSQMCTM